MVNCIYNIYNRPSCSIFWGITVLWGKPTNILEESLRKMISIHAGFSTSILVYRRVTDLYNNRINQNGDLTDISNKKKWSQVETKVPGIYISPTAVRETSVS